MTDGSAVGTVAGEGWSGPARTACQANPPASTSAQAAAAPLARARLRPIRFERASDRLTKSTDFTWSPISVRLSRSRSSSFIFRSLPWSGIA